jgi:hypothetical protein
MLVYDQPVRMFGLVEKPTWPRGEDVEDTEV